MYVIYFLYVIRQGRTIVVLLCKAVLWVKLGEGEWNGVILVQNRQNRFDFLERDLVPIILSSVVDVVLCNLRGLKGCGSYTETAKIIKFSSMHFQHKGVRIKRDMEKVFITM